MEYHAVILKMIGTYHWLIKKESVHDVFKWTKEITDIYVFINI